MRMIRFLSVLVLACATLLAACGRKPPKTLLGYIPADTAYVFANVDPMPRAYVDAWSQRFAPLAEIYAEMLSTARADLAKKDALPANRAALALLAELEGKISVAGFEQLGFTTQAHWAFYGIGAAPVLRIELRDPGAFRAFIARVEQRMGAPIAKARVDKQDYWRFEAADKGPAAVMALVDEDLVLALVPRQSSEDLLKGVLGLELPDDTLQDGGALAAVNRDFGFTPYGSGYVDLVRIVGLLGTAAASVEGETLRALGWDEGTLTPVCNKELLQIVGRAPRFSFGYTRFEPDAMDTRMVLETDAELGGELRSLAAAVPGLGVASDALVDFGMSLKLEALNTIVAKHAAAIAAQPYKCPQLATLNSGAKELQTQLSNPVTFAAAPVLQGFHAALTRLELGAGEPEFAGKLLVASDNPQSLVAMAKNFVPQLQSLALVAGGPPVPVPAELAPAGAPPLHVAMAGKAIAFAVGSGEEAGLAQFIAAPSAQPPPLFAFGYSGRFLGDIMEMSGSIAGAASADRDATRRMTETMRKVYGESVDRLDTTIVATERGLEVRQGMRFK